MAPLKKKVAKKRKAPRRMPKKTMAPFYGTGMNRDIPMGGAGGSQNLLSNLLASRGSTGGGGAANIYPGAAIQAQDQSRLAEDVRNIKAEQAKIAAMVEMKKPPASLKQAAGGEQTVEEKKGISRKRADQAAKLMLLETERRRQAESDASVSGAAKPMPMPSGEGTRLVYIPKDKVYIPKDRSQPRVYIGSLATPPETIIRMEDAGQMETPAAVGMPNSPPFNVVPNPMRQPLAPPPERLRMAAADFSHSLLGREGGGSYDDDDDAEFRQINGLM